ERRLAGAARAGQQDGVRNAPRADRVAQWRGDLRLARDLVEALGPPLAREYLVAQSGAFRRRDAAREDRRAPPTTAGSPLPLLPSGPDGVHEAPTRPGPRRPPSP